MKIYYNIEPEGVAVSLEDVNLDITIDGKLVGIEILEASKKIDIKTILSYTLELDENILKERQI